MSPYEILQPGGSVEHWNEEDGATWFKRVFTVYPKCAWLNPLPPEWWDFAGSVRMIRQLFAGRMFTLTLDGLDAAMRCLSR